MGSTIPKTFLPQSSSLAGQAVTRGVVCHDVRISNRSALAAYSMAPHTLLLKCKGCCKE